MVVTSTSKVTPLTVVSSMTMLPATSPVRPTAVVEPRPVSSSSIRKPRNAAAIDGLGDSVGDRFSGTRLAFSHAKLLRHRTWSTLVRARWS
jgi:hypothetical protein